MGNLSAAAEALCKSRMPRSHGGAVGARTALQADYLATVQEALSGNRWGRVLSQASQASDDKVALCAASARVNFSPCHTLADCRGPLTPRRRRSDLFGVARLAAMALKVVVDPA